MTSCNQCPLWLPRRQDLKSLTLRWHSFRGWGMEHFSTNFEQDGGQFIQKKHECTIVNIVRLKVRYLNPTTKRTTRNIKANIVPDRSIQTRQNPMVEGYRPRIRPPRCNGLCFRLVPKSNWTVFPVQTQTAGGLPGHVANTSLGWCTFAEWCSDSVTCCFAYRGSQYNDYAMQQLNHITITLLTRRKIIDARFTLFCITSWAVCQYHLCIKKRSILQLSINTTHSMVKYLFCTTKHSWRSVDTDFALGNPVIFRHLILPSLSFTSF